MKTISLFLGMILTLSGCAGAPFTGEFTQSGTADSDAGAAGEMATAGAAGAADGSSAGKPSQAQAGATSAAAGSAGEVEAGGAPPVSSAGSASTAGSAGAAPAVTIIAAPCDDATNISNRYFSGMSTDAICVRTKESFNTLRFVAGNPLRDVRVNGGPVMHCSDEPSEAWGNVCTLKGDFSATDADGYHYVQVSSFQYGMGALIWVDEPAGEPCTDEKSFAYSKDASYIASDRVTADCVGAPGTCEYRCMSADCSGVSTVKAPKWELVQSCEGK